jgi:hypothetical protein
MHRGHYVEQNITICSSAKHAHEDGSMKEPEFILIINVIEVCLN